jgi:hypothetical protein
MLLAKCTPVISCSAHASVARVPPATWLAVATCGFCRQPDGLAPCGTGQAATDGTTVAQLGTIKLAYL